MNIQSVKRVLLAITTSMVVILVLMPRVAFCELPPFTTVMIDTVSNTCAFYDINGELVSVTPPQRIKVVERNGRLKGTCFDDITKTESGRLFYQGAGNNLTQHCTLITSSGTVWADYTEKIDKHGATLTCEYNPLPPS